MSPRISAVVKHVNKNQADILHVVNIRNVDILQSAMFEEMKKKKKMLVCKRCHREKSAMQVSCNKSKGANDDKVTQYLPCGRGGLCQCLVVSLLLTCRISVSW